MSSIYDGPGSLLHVWSIDYERGPLYLAGQCATVLERLATHANREHECNAFGAQLAASNAVKNSRLPDSTSEERADDLRDALEHALDCADAIRAQRAVYQRAIDTARIALAALEEAERDADRMAHDARAALVAAGAAQ